MKRVVGEQFNEGQLVIARGISSSIERELNLLKKEVSLNPDAQHKRIQESFSRVLESGVWKIEIVEPERQRSNVYTSYIHWTEKKTSISHGLPHTGELDHETARISKLRIKTSGITLILDTSLAGDSSMHLLFEINISWFITPFLKNIRSGKTGYAWLIDEKGAFLFHPEAVFVGKSVFTVRKKKDPDISFGMINLIIGKPPAMPVDY